MMTLNSLYQELKSGKPNEGSFKVRPFSSRIYFGLDADKKPSLFVVEDKGDVDRQFSFKTSKITIELSREYELVFEDSSKKNIICHRLTCSSSDQGDLRAFLSIMQAYIDTASSYDLSRDGLTSFFHSLVRLFRIEPEKELLLAREGLWAELFFMKTHGGFEKWAASWHSDPLNIFDFSVRGKRIEVKSTLKNERIHEFSHAQVYSRSDDIKIVSLMLRTDDAGESLKSLIIEARDSFKKTSHFFKLERVVRKAGMENIEEEGPKYSASFAQDNLLWFNASDVPRFNTTEPEGVSCTHYRSDFTKAHRLSVEDIQNWIDKWELQDMESNG
ncbi:MAG: PD-(D/E)XK motif protein [Patescibacteria group bacterium]|nr:PD-(D/E)XK motif protein [Patescibacteria group bacterium]